MSGAILTPMMNNDVGEDAVCASAFITGANALQKLLELSITVIFTVDIPALEAGFQMKS